MARTKFVRTKPPFFFCTTIEWSKATETKQGKNEKFSTGSHPHHPPQPRTPYAQYPPSMMPAARLTTANSTHGMAIVCHSVYTRFHNDAIARANGTASEAKPMNKIGGWIAIHMFCSSGFNPRPSGGICPAANCSGWTSHTAEKGVLNTSRSIKNDCRNP